MQEARFLAARQKSARRVLLVEGQPWVREAIMAALDGVGLSTADAASAEAALRVIGASPEPPPLALVTQTEMPTGQMDGLTLAAKVRRRWPDLGVVFATGHPSRLDGQVLGPRDRFLAKPVNPAALVRAVRGLVAPRGRCGGSAEPGTCKSMF